MKRGPRETSGNGKRTYLQRVIVAREGMGICFYPLMIGEEGTRILSSKKKKEASVRARRSVCRTKDFSAIRFSKW